MDLPGLDELDHLAVAERLSALAVWARRKFTIPMSSSALSTLVSLERCGPLRISDLAEREQLTQPGMTTLVNRLEQERYAERTPDPSDGRATLVRLTDPGRAFIAEQRQGCTRTLLAEVTQLTEADQRALLGALDALDHLTGSDTGSPAAVGQSQSPAGRPATLGTTQITSPGTSTR